MTFDVTKHELVPKHAKLGDKEKEAVLSEYNITIKELPKMFATDPALEKLNVKPGDVIKIERSSRTAGNTVYYRVVMEG
jgi:DNA-directed RNA polymerase subunit H (RpoH/RPB5)